MGVLSIAPALALRRNFDHGRILLGRAQTAFLNGNLSSASRDFRAARTDFETAANQRGNFLLRIDGLVPYLGRTPRALLAIADIGERISSAGVDVSAEVARLPGGLNSLGPTNGQIPLDRLGAVAPAVHRARISVDVAVALAERLPSSWLLGPVAAARNLVADRLDQIAPLARSADALLHSMPAFAGQDGPKTILRGHPEHYGVPRHRRVDRELRDPDARPRQDVAVAFQGRTGTGEPPGLRRSLPIPGLHRPVRSLRRRRVLAEPEHDAGRSHRRHPDRVAVSAGPGPAPGRHHLLRPRRAVGHAPSHRPGQRPRHRRGADRGQRYRLHRRQQLPPELAPRSVLRGAAPDRGGRVDPLPSGDEAAGRPSHPGVRGRQWASHPAFGRPRRRVGLQRSRRLGRLRDDRERLLQRRADECRGQQGRLLPATRHPVRRDAGARGGPPTPTRPSASPTTRRPMRPPATPWDPPARRRPRICTSSPARTGRGRSSTARRGVS